MSDLTDVNPSNSTHDSSIIDDVQCYLEIIEEQQALIREYHHHVISLSISLLRHQKKLEEIVAQYQMQRIINKGDEISE